MDKLLLQRTKAVKKQTSTEKKFKYVHTIGYNICWSEVLYEIIHICTAVVDESEM